MFNLSEATKDRLAVAVMAAALFLSTCIESILEMVIG